MDASTGLKHTRMKRFLGVLTAILLTATALVAQQPGGGNRAGGSMTGAFYGKIIDSITGKGLEAASVQLYTNKFDSATKSMKQVLASGMLTRANGDFRLESIAAMGQYKLVITAIGFKEVSMPVALIDKAMMDKMRSGSQDMSAMMGALDKDLGNIKLGIDQQILGNVTVESTKPLVQLAIDRKVYNVEKDLAATGGGTAADVMKNVPSLNVDIDGNVTLRNSSPQIFVDGRPTTLTLDQIPADQIASVEVITNPSAKFDASGGTGGILNIVLKKARRVGYSGNIRAGIDMRGKFNIGGDINVRQGKLNFFANGNYGQRKSISDGTTDRLTTIKAPNTNMHQVDESIRDGYFAFGRAGFDYFINNRNTITLSGSAVRGQFKNKTTSDIFVDTLFSLDPKRSYTQRYSDGEGNFRNYGGALGYVRNFQKSGHQLTADVNYNTSKNDNISLVSNNIFPNFPTGSYMYRYRQQQVGAGDNQQITIQTDYTNPLTDNSKLEAGIRYNQRNNDSRNTFGVLDDNGNVTVLAPLSSKFKYTDRIYAAYSSYTGRFSETFGYMVGLRVEGSDYSGRVHSSVKDGASFKDTSNSYSISYPVSFFPSVFLSKKLKADQDLQLNYSRRINRPNFFQLFPFTDYSDSLNLSRGNPGLKPEFTNSIEISYQKTFPKNNSLLISAYYKHTTDLITRYQAQEKNPLNDSTVFVNTFINANSSFVGGIEFVSKNRITKWWDITSNLNLYTSKINIDDPAIQTTGQLYSWFAKINNSFKLPKNFTLQLTGDYMSKTVLSPGGSSGQGGGGGGGWGPTVSGNSQGYTKPSYSIDAALRFEFLKNKAASITLNVSDIFKTRISDVYTQSTSFNQHAVRTRDQQFFRLNFNYRFGKFDASLFKRKNIKGEQENMQNSMQGAQ
jgi:outer membrane receptor protein involved in Fe transport